MNNVVLIGFMGSGKSTVGRILAERTNRSFADLDDDIAADAGRPISEIFADEGEAGFRERESRSLRRALEQDDRVLAVGGGAPLADDNWHQIRDGNCVVALTAQPAELARRLNGASDRPLLQPDPPSAIASLLPGRMHRYLEADLVVSTDGKPPAEISTHIDSRLSRGGPNRIPVEVPGATHEVAIGFHLVHVAAHALQTIAAGRPIAIVSDWVVAERHGNALQEALRSIGCSPTMHLVPTGEAAKQMRALNAIYTALAGAGVDRQSLLVALGGGCVGDVAGFAAATWMRGIRYVQMPTTLLAMVDSSIGGKTAINLPAGKNLVGAVHQPAAIFCDIDYLETLPGADYRAALAEIIKVAMIADRSLVEWLSANMAAMLRRDKDIVHEAIRRAIGIKASVVSRDPLEAGERAILNYGHTLGHALERAVGYGQLRHGEAVAWGMEVAARISVMSGACRAEDASLQHNLLERAGLLRNGPAPQPLDLLSAMQRDKKSRAGKLRWVLLREAGRADFGCDVDEPIVWQACKEVLGV